MRAGEFNDRIDIQRQETDLDASRCPVTTWKNYLRRWAKVTQEGAGGKAETTTRQTITQGQWRVIVRRDSGTVQVTSKMRVMVGAMSLNIEGIVDDRRELITLICTERPEEDSE